ncbi:MAG TPA: hypothetical protein VGC27_05410 [Rhizomicrobium sp.]
MNETIDDLLRQMPVVPDDGFSRRVMAGVRAMERRRMFVTAAAVALGIVLALLILPLREIGVELGAGIPKIASSAALGLAMAAMILTLLLDREFSRL